MQSSENTFRRTLAQLEAGMTVGLVAATELESFDVSLPSSFAKNIMAEHDFSQAPVTRDGEVIGTVGIDIPLVGPTVAEWMSPLTAGSVISSHTSLRNAISILANDVRRYRLVVGTNGINGIVTRSDLGKLPVRMLAFSLVTHLESVFANTISRNLPQDLWVDYIRKGGGDLPRQAIDILGPTIGSSAVERLFSNQEKLRKRDATPDLMEITEFGQKWFVVHRHFGLSDDFAIEMAGVQKYLRNVVAHGRSLVADEFQLEQLDRRLGICENWIGYFSDSGKVASQTASIGVPGIAE